MEDQSRQAGNIHNEEVSLKDFILQIRKWCGYLLTKWKIILLVTLLGGSLGVAYALIKKATYQAELTFIVEENKSSPLGAYANLASQFGIDLGSSGSGVFAGDNILEFLRSKLMIEKTLLSPDPQSKSHGSLADLFIETYQLHDKWGKEKGLDTIRFPTNVLRKNYSLQQDSILNVLYKTIGKQYLKVSKPDKKLSFILVECVTQNEIFSKFFIEQLVNEATDFYINTKTKRSRSNVDKLQEKADSIEHLLNRKTYLAAEKQDLNQNPARQVAMVGTELEMRDKIVLQTMYVEVVKNLEISKMAMLQETPIIQVVDTPGLPLKKNHSSLVLSVIAGMFLGGFLTILCLLGLRMYHNLMQ